MALYKEVVFPYGEPDSHSNSSHTVSLGKNDSDAILGSGPSSFSRHARLSRKKDPEKGWVDLCTQLDTEVAAQLEECHKAYAEVTPVYENGQLVQQITRYSDSPEVRIRYYLNEFPTQKANESVFGSFPVTHDHNDLEKHQATEMWVKNCAARDAAFARDNSSTTNSSPYQPRTVRFADEQVSTPPDLVSDTAFAHLSHLSEGELASAYRQQCGKMDASFKKCDVMADFLYNKVESLTAYFNAFDAEARMLQCRQLCPEVYEAAEQLPSMQLQLLNAQHYINDLMEEVKQHKIDAQNSRGFAIRAKEEKKGLQQTFDELTRELYVGFPLNQFSEKQIMNRKIADLEEKLRAKTVECNGKDLMITVLKNEIDQHETNASSYSKENKVLRTQTHALQNERDLAVTTAKKTQAELDTTQKELELTYEALRDLQSHTADAFEVSQTNIMEGTVALEDLTNQITVLCKEVDVYHRENKSLALQLRVEQEKNSGTKKFMDGIVKGYIKILSEKEGRSLLEMISLQDSEDKVTGSSASPRQKRVKAWLKETTQGKEKEESADLTTSTGQSDAEIGRGRPRTRDPIVTANTKV